MQHPLDPVAAVTHPNPYPYYDTLAQQASLAWDAHLNLWIAAHPVLVRAVMTHADCHVRPLHEAVPAAIIGPAGNVFGELARMNDGARHAARRAALAPVLAPWTDVVVARHARRVATMLLRDGIGTAAQLNFFTQTVPVCTVASLLGCAEDDLPRIAQWTAAFVACLSPLSTAPQVAQAHSAAQALLGVLGALPTARGADPIDAANLLGLLSQTYEATAGLLGNCIVGLLRGAAPVNLVATTMRRDPAIHNTRRFAAREVTIGPLTVHAGQGILVVLAAAGMQHGFGHGPHCCPGKEIACIIAEYALETLLAAGPLPRVAWRYRPSVNARIPVFMAEAS